MEDVCNTGVTANFCSERASKRAMPLTADLIAYLKADVSRLTYLWKR